MGKVRFRPGMLKGYIRQHLRASAVSQPLHEMPETRSSPILGQAELLAKALVGTTVRLFDEKALLRWKTHFGSSGAWAWTSTGGLGWLDQLGGRKETSQAAWQTQQKLCSLPVLEAPSEIKAQPISPWWGISSWLTRGPETPSDQGQRVGTRETEREHSTHTERESSGVSSSKDTDLSDRPDPHPCHFTLATPL